MSSRVGVAAIAAVFVWAVIGLVGSASAAPATDGGPLKVFILAGQSNMQGHAHVRTIPAMALDPATEAIRRVMCDADGTPRVLERVWISELGSGGGSGDGERIGRLSTGFGPGPAGAKFGPEFTFGLFLGEWLDEPILIIKTAWGGRSLHTDFRPPGAGLFPWTEAQLERLAVRGEDLDRVRARKREATGRAYREMIEHVQSTLTRIDRIVPGYDADRGFELAGFVWFQGWNDMVDSDVYPDRDEPGAYRDYSDLLAQFIVDVRNDLQAPSLPFVIGVMGVGGPLEAYGPDRRREEAIHRSFREAMAEPAGRPAFAGTVRAVPTAPFWDTEFVSLRDRHADLQRLDEADRAAGEARRIDPAVTEARIAERRRLAFTDRERQMLEESTSDGDYHYLGSARVMAPIGKAFAEAMADLLQIRRAE